MTTSPAEHLLSVQLEQAGIPFEREYRFAPEDWCREHGYLTPTGRPKKWRADFHLPFFKHYRFPGLLIEIEGGGWSGGRHTTGTGFHDDMTKYNAAAELGFTVLRFSTRSVNDGTAIEQIRRILSKERDAA